MRQESVPKERRQRERVNSPEQQKMIDTRQKQSKPQEVIEPRISNAQRPEEEQKLPASKVDIVDDGLNLLANPIVEKNQAPDKETEEEKLQRVKRSSNSSEEQKVQDINQKFS